MPSRKKDTPFGAEKGTRYGWLVVNRVIKSGRKAEIEFLCDCGCMEIKKLYVVKHSAKKNKSPRCHKCISELKRENAINRFDSSKYIAKKFGRILVTGVDLDITRRNSKNRLVCRCDCGAQSIVTVNNLLRGKTLSCGCIHDEFIKRLGENAIEHGHTTNGELNGHTSIYRAWMKIKGCVEEGIRNGFHIVCHEYDPRWKDFNNFYADFGDISMHQTISRINNKMPWSKENCFVNIGRRHLKID